MRSTVNSLIQQLRNDISLLDNDRLSNLLEQLQETCDKLNGIDFYVPKEDKDEQQ